ncbi:Retrotransposon gag protein [Rhizoctonia solani]|uniref:Retrotransposon gag protein n=1 Tax=Rhizoctonia solani TaxID=456999 RepID=A0A8H8NQF6_9AGAM|nr:Retrotransposon gag protein [Rhizoctonia solani]QRW18004.1 Retrotransposon gag protein [Rhizoctonia solani]
MTKAIRAMASYTTPLVEIGEVSLEQITCLLLGLLGQVKNLEQKLEEVKEVGIKTQTNVKNISQTVDVVKDGLKSLQLHGPRTPETKPPVVEATPRPLPKTKPIGLVTPAPPPPAPIAAYPALVKVDHPDAYTGKIGSEAKQWLTRMLAWTHLNLRMFPTNQEVLSFLLMNMKDSARAWAHPHLDQLGSHWAIIQTVEGFKLEFLAAFSNPDTTRAAKQKITTLTQSSTCTDYITKFRTLAMELDWNDATLRGQFACSLHWEPLKLTELNLHKTLLYNSTLLELQNAALVIDNMLQEERTSHPPKDSKTSKSPNPARGTSTSQQATPSRKLSNNPNYVLEEEQNHCCTAGACIKCRRMGHKFAECCTRWKETPIKEGVKKEAAKIGKESGPISGKD